MPDYVGSSLNNPITGLGRGGAIQPINASSSQVSGNDGTATFTFPYIALGQVWTVSANCAFAPDTALFRFLDRFQYLGFNTIRWR